MRKYVIGFVIGVLVMAGSSAFADGAITNLIGKTIQGQFNVSIDGKQFKTPAIVVDGTSFLPVREFGESVGYAVYFDTEGGIELEKKTTSELMTIEEMEQFQIESKLQSERELKQMQDEIDAKNEMYKQLEFNPGKQAAMGKKIKQYEERISEVRQALDAYYKNYLDFGNDPEVFEQTDGYKSAMEKINGYQAQIDEWQSQLDAIQ